MRSLVRVLRMSYTSCGADGPGHPFRPAASTSVADALRTYAARTGRCFTPKSCLVFDRDGARASTPATIARWTPGAMDAGEAISVFDAGSLFLLKLRVPRALRRRSTAARRSTSAHFGARRRGPRGRARERRPPRRRGLYGGLARGQGPVDAPYKTALHLQSLAEFAGSGLLPRALRAFIRGVYDSDDEDRTAPTTASSPRCVRRATTDESAVLALMNWWLRDDARERRDGFARKSLLCGSSVAPYAGHRLVGVPVQLEGSDTTCSLGALSAGRGGNDWCHRHKGRCRCRARPATPRGQFSAPAGGWVERLCGADARNASARGLPTRLRGSNDAARRAARRGAQRSLGGKAGTLPVYDFTSRLAVCTSCGETQTDKSQQEGARAKTLTLFRPSTGTSTSVDPDELALAHDRQTLPCLTSGSNIRTATVVVLDVSTSMGTDYSRLEAVDSEGYDRTEVRVAGLSYDDPDPKATAKAALPKSVQPLVRKMSLFSLKADDARGAKGSFGGTVFVDLGSVAAARTAPRRRGRALGDCASRRARGGAKKDNRRARDQHPTRLRAVTEGFKVLADRAMALEGGAMALGLVTFSDVVREVTPVKAAREASSTTSTPSSPTARRRCGTPSSSPWRSSSRSPRASGGATQRCRASNCASSR